MDANDALTKKLDQFSQDNSKLSIELVSQRDENAKLTKDLRDTKQTPSNSQHELYAKKILPDSKAPSNGEVEYLKEKLRLSKKERDDEESLLFGSSSRQPWR